MKRDDDLIPKNTQTVETKSRFQGNVNEIHNRGHQNGVVDSRARFAKSQNLSLAKEGPNASKYTIGVTKMAWLILGADLRVRRI